MRLSDKFKTEMPKTPYRIIAEEFGVCIKFVGMIARGERTPQRGKGLLIKQRLEQLANEIDNNLNTP